MSTPALNRPVNTLNRSAPALVSALMAFTRAGRPLTRAVGVVPRGALTGTLWELDEKELRLVATDCKRLAFARCEAKPHGGDEPPGKGHIVPTRAMQLLERLLGDPEQSVKVALRENVALIRVGAAVIYTRLIEGRYPPYSYILSKTKKVSVPGASCELLPSTNDFGVFPPHRERSSP